MPELYILESAMELPLARARVFGFFADVANLPRITPPWLHLRLRAAEPVTLAAGVEFDLTLRWRGVPLRWRTRIDAFDAPERFIDRQLSGPYLSWRHVHTFAATPTGTRMEDRVEYQLPWGPIGRLARALTVRRQLEEIFAYRERMVRHLLLGEPLEGQGPDARPAGP